MAFEDSDRLDIGRGVPDQLGGIPANTPPPKGGGEWDSDGKGHPEASPGPDAIDKLEQHAWQHDPDQQGDVDFDIDVEAETPPDEAQAEADGSEGQEELEQVEVQSDDEDQHSPPAATPRAQERIVELNQRAKAAEAKASKLEQLLEQFVAVQTRQASFQEQAIAEQQQRQAQQAEIGRRQALLDKFKELGLDDTKVEGLVALEAMEQAQRSQQQIEAMQQHYQQQLAEAQYRAYETALGSALEQQLQGVQLGSEANAVKQRLYEQAYALARVNQIADPKEAVTRTLAPILPVLRTQQKQRQAPKPPPPNQRVNDVISTSGRASAQQKGQTASGKKPLAPDVARFLR